MPTDKAAPLSPAVYCRYCGERLPRPVPAGVTCCRDWARAKAREWNETMTADEADDLTLWPVLCAMLHAMQHGLDELSEEVMGPG
jgi:hypothetical protein